ncbi:glycoside hydrolase family 3 N-terminal domain-containing protein [Kitasatospora sp. NPDC002227]|uniref:glycoside hydrolase family 3 N-terminal domain-containing protein n=1 Tax=Kitasatospora sp. NPDC002227 TaxID=3154773 RepID=UPI00331A3B33
MRAATRLLTAGLVLLAAACSTGAPAPSGQPLPAPTVTTTPPPSPAPSPTPTPPPTPAFTDRQLAGQRVIYSYSGDTPPASLLDDIRAGQAAGVIFFGPNTADPERFAAAVAQLRAAQQESPVRLPLLLMTDQEGGLVRRLPGAPALSARQTGEAEDPVAAAREAGTEAGQNLAAHGLNVNLAPVLDVYDRPGNFIDRPERSYGRDPAQVAALGGAFVTAQQATGVAATAKHFPGLGTAPAGRNTDTGEVTLDASAARLATVDEAPYPAAIAAGVKLVMVSWAVYPALDPDRPAGLSPRIVRDELRHHLGFQGVTITDALEAGALSPTSRPTPSPDPTETATHAVSAALAGMDLLLCSAQTPAQAETATTALTTALTTGHLDRPDFLAAVARVNALRSTLN